MWHNERTVETGVKETKERARVKKRRQQACEISFEGAAGQELPRMMLSTSDETRESRVEGEAKGCLTDARDRCYNNYASRKMVGVISMELEEERALQKSSFKAREYITVQKRFTSIAFSICRPKING